MNIYEIATITIAACALVFTIWQAFVQRKHNKVSVRPHLFIFTNREKNNNNAVLIVRLINNGLGPAFITKFQIYLNKSQCPAEQAVESVLKGVVRHQTQITQLGDDSAINSRESTTLLTVRFPIAAESEVDAVEKRLDELDLVVKYKSAYEEKFEYSSMEKKSP